MRVKIVSHTTFGAERYRERKKIISELLGPRIKRIEHIGSTAVPGLDAKPIIDILIEVENVADANTQACLVRAGFLLVVDEPGHRMFRSAFDDVHLHAWQSGDPEIERHILFREWLRSNEADRQLYETEKRRLAMQDWPSQNDYAQAKSPVINEILTRARNS
ncbi:MAG TPA: GrpB family protein [Candidatus Rubrimentiphilum sp.]|nr:GrpB family protein [Candidatus Rubrimentiphilum sp.]